MTFLIFVAIAIFFALPFETFGDGTEFAISMASLGISHPPSYPLFILASRIFYLVPAGNMALRLNLFSGLTAVLLAYTIYRLYKGDVIERLALALITLFSRTFFVNAISGEVYALNLLIFVLILFLSERYDDKRYLYLSAFLLGLGAGNHHTILFMIFFVLYRVFLSKEVAFRDVIFSITLFIMGFSVYLYLPIRASQEPLWNWGRPYNFELFLNSFLRRDFRPEGFLRDGKTFLSQLISFNPVTEFGFLATTVLLLLLCYLYKRDKTKFFETVFLVFLYSVFIVLLLGNDRLSPEERKETYAVFFIPAYFMLIYGAFLAMKGLQSRWKTGLILIALFGVMLNQRDILKNFTSFDKTAFAHDLSSALLSSLPNKAVLILTGGEYDFPILYQQKLLRRREDVKIINLTALGKRWNAKESLEVGTTYTKGFEGERDSKKQILKAVILFQRDFRNRDVFLNVFDENELPETLSYKVRGLCYSPGDKPATLDFVRKRSLKGAPPEFVEILKASKEVYESEGNEREVRLADALIKEVLGEEKQ